MNIEQAAKASGVPVMLITHYDELGLLFGHAVSIRPGHVFSEEDVGRLIFVRRAIHLGFTVEHLREVLAGSAELRDDSLASPRPTSSRAIAPG